MNYFKFLLLLVLGGVLILSGCANTVRGVGKDVRDTGRALEDTVN